MPGTDRSSEHETTPSAADSRVSGTGTQPHAEAEADTLGGEGAPVDALATVERLLAAEAEAARLKDEYLRALAEMENVRRRAARDRQEASQYAISGFSRDLLSVADNLRRALSSVESEARQGDPVLDALMSGVEMTEKELLSVFERWGLKPIAAEGQPFDPHVHEAMFEIPNPAVPHGTVLQVLQPGYTLHDRTLRPARVGIAKGGPKPGAQAAVDAESVPVPDANGRVVEFPQPGGGDPYRKPGESDGEAAGSQLDETH